MYFVLQDTSHRHSRSYSVSRCSVTCLVLAVEASLEKASILISISLRMNSGKRYMCGSTYGQLE